MGRKSRMVLGSVAVIGAVAAGGAILVSWSIGREIERIPVGIRQMLDEQRVRGVDGWTPYPIGDAALMDAMATGIVDRDEGYRVHRRARVSGSWG